MTEILQITTPRPLKERALESILKIEERLASVRHKERGWPTIDAELAQAAIHLKAAKEKLTDLPADVRPVRTRGARAFADGAVYKVKEIARERILKILSSGGSAPSEDAADFAVFVSDLGDNEAMCTFIVEGQEKSIPVRTKDLAEEVIAK